MDGVDCDTFSTPFAKVYASADIQTYLSERYSDLLEIVAENTNLTGYFAAIDVYDVLKIQVSDSYCKPSTQSLYSEFL